MCHACHAARGSLRPPHDVTSVTWQYDAHWERTRAVNTRPLYFSQVNLPSLRTIIPMPAPKTPVQPNMDHCQMSQWPHVSLSPLQCPHHLWDGCLLPVRPGLSFWLIIFWCSCHNQIIEDDMILEGGWQHVDCCKLSIGYLCTLPQPKIFHLFGRKVATDPGSFAAFDSFPFWGEVS